MGRLLASCPRMVDLILHNLPARVVISNPVPLQTSLYAIHRGRLQGWAGMRDKIWRRIWNLRDDGDEPAVQQDFLNRLGRYAPFAIVSACTSSLRPRVNTLLMGADYGDRLFETDHPSVWIRRQSELASIR